MNQARFGMMTRPGRYRPDRTLGDRDTMSVDGVRLQMFDAGPGESYADAWRLIGEGSRAAAVIGDLANGAYRRFFRSGHSRDWIASLDRLEQTLPAGAAVYIGHDLAAVDRPDPRRGPGILGWQRSRLIAFRDAVIERTRGERVLRGDEIDRIVGALHKDAPENLEAFDFPIRTSANVLAAELILEKQKTIFEENLKAAVAAGIREDATRTGRVERKPDGSAPAAEGRGDGKR